MTFQDPFAVEGCPAISATMFFTIAVTIVSIIWPADLSEFEISHFFRLKPEQRHAVRSRYNETLRLGAALQIGFLRMCGRPLDAVQRVPRTLLEYLGQQLDVPLLDIATLRGLYQTRRRTLHEHQSWASEFLGMIRLESTDAPRICESLEGLVRAGFGRDQLVTGARQSDACRVEHPRRS